MYQSQVAERASTLPPLRENAMGLILVVDDEPDARELLAMLLELEGHAVKTARDGLEALEVLRDGLRPSLILLDVMMPRLSGFGVLSRVRQMPGLAEVPVVLVSGVADLTTSPVELGVAAAMTKPVDPDLLVETVRRYCRAPEAPGEESTLGSR